MNRHRIYVSNRNRVNLVCPHCGVYRPVNVARVRVLGKPVKARCSCGQSFVVEFERRGLHRKSIRLPGFFKKPESQDIGYDDILIEDLSRGGLSFRVIGRGDVEEGDLLDVEFRLDNADQTPIRARVLVRHIMDEKVGCQFVNLDLGMLKTISFYVMP